MVGYTRVSTVEQGDRGAGLDAQEAAIRSDARRRGWDLVATLTDTASGTSMRKRPGLDAALAMIERGDADALVVAKVDRLSRSLLDFAGIVERSRKQDWQLVALDLGVDTTTPQGEMLASVLAVFAQFERRLIGERTKRRACREARQRRPARPAAHTAAKRRAAHHEGAHERRDVERDRGRAEPRRGANGTGWSPVVASNRPEDRADCMTTAGFA